MSWQIVTEHWVEDDAGHRVKLPDRTKLPKDFPWLVSPEGDKIKFFTDPEKQPRYGCTFTQDNSTTDIVNGIAAIRIKQDQIREQEKTR